MQAAYPTGVYLNFLFGNGSIITARWGKIPPRSTYAWFINLVSADAGVLCPAGSSRASNCPSGWCSAMTYQWATLSSKPFLVVEIPPVAYHEPRVTVLLDGQDCSGLVNCSSAVTLASEASLPPSSLVIPSEDQVPLSQQDACQWLLIPNGRFAPGCNSLNTDKGTYVSQSGFCDLELGSCMNEQLGDIWKQPSLHVCNLLDSSTFDLKTFNYTSRPTELSNVTVTVQITTQSIRQPSLEAIGDLQLFTSSETPLLLHVTLNVSNTGDLAASASLDLDCGPHVVLDRLTSPIAPLSSVELEAFLTITEKPHLPNITCSVAVNATKLPYWRDVVQSALPDLVVPLESNGCWASVPPTTLFFPSESWIEANLSSIYEENGLLGPNPSNLIISSFADTSSRYFRVVAQLFSKAYGITSNTSMITSFRCNSSLGAVESNFSAVLQANTTTPLESEFFLPGDSQSSHWLCSMQMTLQLSPCAPSMGATAHQEFVVDLAASPCFTSGSGEPSLFQPVAALRNASTSLDRNWMNFSATSSWSTIPSTGTGWAHLNLPTPNYPISSSQLIVVTSNIVNAGNATANVIINVTCAGVVGVEIPMSSSTVAIPSSGSSSIQLVFVSNSSAPTEPQCRIFLQVVIPTSVCWSLVGKNYFQSIVSWSSKAVSPPNSPKLPPVAIAFAVIAPLAVVGALAVAVVVILQRRKGRTGQRGFRNEV